MIKLHFTNVSYNPKNPNLNLIAQIMRIFVCEIWLLTFSSGWIRDFIPEIDLTLVSSGN